MPRFVGLRNSNLPPDPLRTNDNPKTNFTSNYIYDRLPSGREFWDNVIVFGDIESPGNDIYHKLGMFNIIGHILGNKVRVFWGHNSPDLRSFVLLLGPSSIGKSASLSQMISILSRAEELDMTFFKRKGIQVYELGWNYLPIQFPSTSKLATEIQEKGEGDELYPLLIYMDEFADLLTSSKQGYGENILNLLINLYDGKSYHKGTHTNPVTLTNPQVSLAGCGTPSLIGKLTDSEIRGGSIARCIGYNKLMSEMEAQSSRERYHLEDPIELDKHDLDQLSNVLRVLKLFTKMKNVEYWGLYIKPEDAQILIDYHKKMIDYAQNEDLFGPMVERYTTYIGKFAAILELTEKYKDWIHEFEIYDHETHNGGEYRKFSLNKGNKYDFFNSQTDKPEKRCHFKIIRKEAPILKTVERKNVQEAANFVLECFKSMVQFIYTPQEELDIPRFVKVLQDSEDELLIKKLLGEEQSQEYFKEKIRNTPISGLATQRYMLQKTKMKSGTIEWGSLIQTLSYTHGLKHVKNVQLGSRGSRSDLFCLYNFRSRERLNKPTGLCNENDCPIFNNCPKDDQSPSTEV